MSENLLTHLLDARPVTRRREDIASTALALLAHGVLLGLLIAAGGRTAVTLRGDQGMRDTGSGQGGGGGGGGGVDAPVMIALAPPTAPPPPVEQPEPPTLPQPKIAQIEPSSIAPVPFDPVPVPIARALASDGAGQGSGTGEGSGGGSGTGSGGGHGDGIGSGTGPGVGSGRLVAATPKVLLIPPSAPDDLRGKTVTVWLEVDATGIVRGVEIVPSTGSRKYDRELESVAMGWQFRPAMDASNRPVATRFPVDVTF